MNTQGENIADNGGIKQAYEAYLAYEQQHGPGERLPGLQDFDSKKLFFMAFGQVRGLTGGMMLLKSNARATFCRSFAICVLGKSISECLFAWLSSQMNHQLCTSHQQTCSPGFLFHHKQR